MSNPPDKPGRLVIVFFDIEDITLMRELMRAATDAGYTVADQNAGSVLLERGY